MTTLSVSSLCPESSYQFKGFNGTGYEYEHTFEAIARDKLRLIDNVLLYLEDPQSSHEGSLKRALKDLRGYKLSEFLMKDVPTWQKYIPDGSFELEYLYRQIDRISNKLAEEYVPVDQVHAWWKKARSRSRVAVRNFQKHPLPADPADKVRLWLQCFDKAFSGFYS